MGNFGGKFDQIRKVTGVQRKLTLTEKRLEVLGGLNELRLRGGVNTCYLMNMLSYDGDLDDIFNNIFEGLTGDVKESCTAAYIKDVYATVDVKLYNKMKDELYLD